MSTKEYMREYLSDPINKEKANIRNREYSNRPDIKAREKKRIQDRQSGGYFVYYIPSTHYCGITKDMYVRESFHRTVNKIDTTGMNILYHSDNLLDAAHHEAMFQSVLGMNGLNVKNIKN
jgi:hypothetical protein